MTKKRTLLLCAASVVLSLASPAVGSFWDNAKDEESTQAEDHTVKLSHHSTSATNNEPVEYGVDVVSRRICSEGEKVWKGPTVSLLTFVAFLQ